ncbi:MAG: UDP-N-acetylmuramoyl-tripeptide--D-alanyl-D-alanine ligase [Epulopiscium sp.]|nr:UDP-N-acetylmuramoyl-tripeptide--D-alanyl-D-alanine ligase [Candidatus Epulonipiscium sp.]
MKSLTFGQIISAVDGRPLNSQLNMEAEISSVSIDSRSIEGDSLYIPIIGDRFDGHLFIEDAFRKGAKLALTQDENLDITDGNLIYVKDTKKALMSLAAYYRSLFNIPVVAVTGSVGKTSTKDLISAVLGAKYKVHKTQGNFNNEIGLPLTIFQIKEDHEVVVLEMGMNHFGEIHNLSNIARPDIAIITNIGDSHIENLGSREGILQAKAEILDGMSDEGLIIINGQDDMLKKLKANQRIITYGYHEDCDFYSVNAKTVGVEGIDATLNTPKSAIEVQILALGMHMVGNALAATAVAKELGLTDNEIKAGFKAYKPTEMRMDLQKTANNLHIINDAYNASPDSMKAALDVLTSIGNASRRIAILGDMFELGEHGESLHRSVGSYIGKGKEIDFLITVGQMSEFIQKQAIKEGMDVKDTIHFNHQEDLVGNLVDIIRKGDLILVKASRGMELEKTVEELGKVNINES